MNLKLHVILNHFLGIYYLVAPFLILAIVFSANPHRDPAIGLVLLVSFTYLLLLLLLMLLIILVPVKCVNPECPGRMQGTNERLSFWTVGSLYTCKECGNRHQAVIFCPDVEWDYS